MASRHRWTPSDWWADTASPTVENTYPGLEALVHREGPLEPLAISGYLAVGGADSYTAKVLAQ